MKAVRSSCLVMAILRPYMMPKWFGYNDPMIEESLYGAPILRQFAGLGLGCIPDENHLQQVVGARQVLAFASFNQAPVWVHQAALCDLEKTQHSSSRCLCSRTCGWCVNS